jgi:hypothetical protein
MTPPASALFDPYRFNHSIAGERKFDCSPGKVWVTIIKSVPEKLDELVAQNIQQQQELPDRTAINIFSDWKSGVIVCNATYSQGIKKPDWSKFTWGGLAAVYNKTYKRYVFVSCVFLVRPAENGVTIVRCNTICYCEYNAPLLGKPDLAKQGSGDNCASYRLITSLSDSLLSMIQTKL